jgi:hypothetical protein
VPHTGHWWEKSLKQCDDRTIIAKKKKKKRKKNKMFMSPHELGSWKTHSITGKQFEEV